MCLFRMLTMTAYCILMYDYNHISIGDLHGQYYDLCNIFKQFEPVDSNSTSNEQADINSLNLSFQCLYNGTKQFLFLGNAAFLYICS